LLRLGLGEEMVRLVLIVALFLFCAACSRGPEPPEVEFLSPTTVRIVHQGQAYILEKDAPPPPGFPFAYRFEPDGDLDLRVGGRWIEFDNPYDLDLDFKLKKNRGSKGRRFYQPRYSSPRSRSKGLPRSSRPSRRRRY